MALTFGQMTSQILSETFRDASFSTQVQNAIVTAIKELETSQMFINQKDTFLLVNPFQESILLPNDFINMLQLTLISPPGQQTIDPTQPLPPPPPPPPYGPNQGFTVWTQARGFNVTTMYELKTYRYFNHMVGSPGQWALYANNIEIYPQSDAYYYLHLFYYFRDGYYPSNPNDTSIWMDDFTQDVTRYRARAIFYRDSLQAPELAQSDMDRSEQAMERLKSRTSDRSTINALSL